MPSVICGRRTGLDAFRVRPIATAYENWLKLKTAARTLSQNRRWVPIRGLDRPHPDGNSLSKIATSIKAIFFKK